MTTHLETTAWWLTDGLLDIGVIMKLRHHFGQILGFECHFSFYPDGHVLVQAYDGTKIVLPEPEVRALLS